MSRDQVRIWGLAPNIARFVTGCHKLRAKAALCPKIELRTIRLPYTILVILSNIYIGSPPTGTLSFLNVYVI